MKLFFVHTKNIYLYDKYLYLIEILLLKVYKHFQLSGFLVIFVESEREFSF